MQNPWYGAKYCVSISQRAVNFQCRKKYLQKHVATGFHETRKQHVCGNTQLYKKQKKFTTVLGCLAFYVEQWFPTLGPQMFLDLNSQKPWPAQLMVKASGSFSPRTSGDPRLGTTNTEETGRLVLTTYVPVLGSVEYFSHQNSNYDIVHTHHSLPFFPLSLARIHRGAGKKTDFPRNTTLLALFLS